MLQCKLELVADEESFFFRPPPGEPLQLHTFTSSKKQEAVQHLLQHRCGFLTQRASVTVCPRPSVVPYQAVLVLGVQQRHVEEGAH